jgi:DNA polymerase elongation subunit (family B)
MVTIPDFTPYVYLELPDTIKWNEYLVQKLKFYLTSLTGRNKIIDCILMRKKKLYYANKTMSDDGKLIDKKMPYLFLSMVTKKDITYLSYKIERELKNMLHIQGLPVIKTKIHEMDASPILQLTTLRDIPTAGWINFKGTPITDEEEKDSSCDSEYIVTSKNLKKSQRDSIVNPIIMGVDIEVNSVNPNVFPKAHIQGNKIFQIACVLSKQGDPDCNYKKYLLSLGNPCQKKTGEDVTILSFKTETKMLEGYAEFIREHNPNIIVGYNIFSFDIPYMIDRAKLLQCIYNFDQQGCLKDKHGVERKIKWSSAAYKNQEFQYLDCAGRLFVDLLPLVQRDYKFDNYKLKTISTHFLGQTKDPLSVKGIFKCYRIFSPDSLAICGKYCVQDSALVVKLFDVLQTWYGLCEMANTCNVPIFYLYTQGQQIKAYSQIYKKCTYDGYVVEKDGYICGENERYTGAYVFDPEPGLYDMVVSFDFSSLYPSTIIAYNIDYSTLVNDDSIPDELCNTFEWTDCFGCEHDTSKRKTKMSKDKIICGVHHKYRFLKEPKGIIPTLLQNLLDARKKTNKEISQLKEQMKETGDKSLQSKIDVLDKRQLSYKISANSMYGCMGVRKGYLPFMPGAMCTTARGRESIQKAAKYLQNEYKAKLIYGDSVTGDTPILVKYEDSTIDILRIDEIGEVWEDYDEFKAGESNRIDKQQTSPSDSYAQYRRCNTLQVWSGEKWSKIQRVIRHRTQKKIYRVLTHTGCVDVTEDHSLLDENKEKVKPGELTIGSKLYSSFPPITDIPEVIFETEHVEGKVHKCHTCGEYRLICEFQDNETTCAKCLVPTQITETEYLEKVTDNMCEELCFVWGMFMAEGSCGDYQCQSGRKRSWAINNQDLVLLEKCKSILEKCEPLFTWKILDTMKSSSVYKLVPSGPVRFIVSKWRKLFYDREGNKKVPYFILNATIEWKKAYFSGFYEGDGDKHTLNRINQFKLDQKGKITTQGLYTLLVSCGYKVGINTKDSKDNVYTLHTCNKFRNVPNEVKKIKILGECKTSEYVYDIETTEGRFHGGIGDIILKNTDSTYISLPGFVNETQASECYNLCYQIEGDVKSLFPSPMKLAFEEKIYWRFFILTKKRYMALTCNTEGKVSSNMFKRGVLLARRDNSAFLRSLYSDVIKKVFYKEDKNNVLIHIVDKLKEMCSNSIDKKQFIITKSVGDVDDYKMKPLPDDQKKREKRLKDLNCTEEEYRLKSLPAQVQLAEKMRRRGKPVDSGTRLEYVVTCSEGDKLFDKMEDAEYFLEHQEIIRLDYMYYLKLASNPLDQLLEVAYKITDFTLNFYKYLVKREKLLNDIRKLGKAYINIIED